MMHWWKGGHGGVWPAPPAGQLSPGDVLYSQFDGNFCVFARAEDIGLRPEDDLKDIDILPSPAPLRPGIFITQVHLLGPSVNNPLNPSPLPVGHTGSIVAQVQSVATGVSGQHVLFTEVAGMPGDVTFAEGVPFCDLEGTNQCLGGARNAQACSSDDDDLTTGCPPTYCDLGGTNQCLGGPRHSQTCTTSDDSPVTGCPPGYTQARLTTDANGEVGIAFQATTAGKVLIKVSVPGTTLAAYALFTVGP